MKNRGFPFHMERTERIAGWIWLPVHMFALSFLVALIAKGLASGGTVLSDSHVTLIYYGISFAFVLIIMFRYLRASFRELCDHKLDSLQALIIGYVLYYVLGYLVAALLGLTSLNLSNPNDDLVIQQTKLNPNVMTVVSVLLAPVAEEVLFRGVAYGTQRGKSMFLAYLVSVALFAVYHMWSFLLDGYGWQIFLYMLQYVPGGIALAWCYEKSKNIWAPIFLHMAINFITLTITVG